MKDGITEFPSGVTRKSLPFELSLRPPGWNVDMVIEAGQSSTVDVEGSGVLRNFYKMKQDPFPENLFDLETPDPGAGDAPILFGIWLVPVGAAVIAGERIAELICQGSVLTISAPVEGTFVEQITSPGSRVSPGDILGRIQTQHGTDSPATAE